MKTSLQRNKQNEGEKREAIIFFYPVQDGWITCDFTSFLTVFQSYQDDVWMIMKGCVQWNSVYGWEDFPSSEDRTRSARAVGQRLTHWATGAPPVQKQLFLSGLRLVEAWNSGYFSGSFLSWSALFLLHRVALLLWYRADRRDASCFFRYTVDFISK